MAVADEGRRRSLTSLPVLRELPRRHRTGKEERLRAAAIFRELSTRRLRQFAALVDELHVVAGQELARVGVPRRFVYLVLDGSVVSSPEKPPETGRGRTVLTAESDATIVALDERFLQLAAARLPELRRLVNDPAVAVVHLNHRNGDEPAAPAGDPGC